MPNGAITPRFSLAGLWQALAGYDTKQLPTLTLQLPKPKPYRTQAQAQVSNIMHMHITLAL
jgi:hypothetical protein